MIEIHEIGRDQWRWAVLDSRGEVICEGHEPCQPGALRVAEHLEKKVRGPAKTSDQ